MDDTHASTRLSLPHFLPYRLATLSNRISRTIAQMYSERFDLTIPEWRVMAILAESPEISAGEVAGKGAMDKVTVSRAVAKLLESGQISRHFAKQDRRRSVLALSEAGRAVYDEIVPLALAYESALLAKLTQEERDTLDRLLARLETMDLERLLG